MTIHTLLLNSFFINLLRDITDLAILNLIANIFGLIAVVLKVVEYQLDKRAIRIILALGGNVCWIAYFFLKGMDASAISAIIAMSSNMVFLLREKHDFFNGGWWLAIFLVMTAINCIIGYKVWMDIFAILAGLFGIIAYFVKNDKLYRILSFACMFSWLLNSVFYQAGIALINDAFATVSVTIAILRKDLIKKKCVEKTEKDQAIM
jgi:hypothetical protein